MKKGYRNLLVYGSIMLFIAIVIFSFGGESTKGKEWTQNEFFTAAKNGEVEKILYNSGDKNVYVLLEGSTIKAEDFNQLKKYDKYFAIADYQQFNTDLKDNGINLVPDAVNPQPNIFIEMLPWLIMLALTGGLLLFIMRGANQGNGKVFTFGKSRAQLQVETGKRITFADVAGADEEKEEMAEVVDFLKHKEKYTSLGARIPKGILLVGSPGTGKTLLAKAVAGEAGVPFFTASGSDFVEMFVGVGASRVRDMFAEAKKNAPCIIFVDEIDAVGRQRGTGLGGGHDEREQTLNQLLVEMDGFTVNEGIVVIAATNRADILDPALLRPGRFDRTITVHLPDVKGREEIFNVHSRNKPLAQDVDPKTVAQLTSGFTGADIENLLNEAALLSARKNKKKITMAEIREAVIRVIAGPEKRSRVVSDKDKRITAYHEAGHALVANKLPNCDPVHEVSIIPRGSAAGYTITLPSEDDMQFMTKTKLQDMIAELLAGRVAEEEIFGDISTGAYSDLQRASGIVRKMITEFGMNDEIGPVFLGSEHEIFIGRDFGAQHTYSDGLAAKIDEQLKLTIEKQYQVAKKIINDNLSTLHNIVEVLIKHEKITRDEFEAIVNGTYVEPDEQSANSLEETSKEQSDEPVQEQESEAEQKDGEVPH